MPNVKIELIKGETVDEADELVFKAFSSQRDGSLHNGTFHDAAMQHLSEKLILMHELQFQRMLLEIFEALEQEHQNGD